MFTRLFLITFLTGLMMMSCDRPKETDVEDILSKMTLEEKLNMIGGYTDLSTWPLERLGIPEVNMTDGPLGVRMDGGNVTAFPAGILLAASFDRSLAQKVGAGIGMDAKANQKGILLAPGMNIYRAPMCGRNFEYYGEDPFLASQMAVSYIHGVQNQGVIATAKHFVANNQEFDRNHTSSDMDERTLHEIYLPAFKASVQQGRVGAVMTSYNLINGIHASEHQHLITNILKNKWEFDGIVMSDWTSVYSSSDAANAGLDLEMPNAKWMNADSLMPAIQSGKVTESVIDDKIRRMLRTFDRFGLMAPMDTSYKADHAQNQAIALDAARGGMVLLKNSQNTLPLKSIKSVAVFGPNAHPAVWGGSGSSLVKPFTSTSVVDGFKKVAPDIRVSYDPGFDLMLTEEIARSSSFYTMINGVKANGLKGEYFSNMTLEGNPNFTRLDSTLYFNWDDPPRAGFPTDQFSVRWTGHLKVESSGLYKFMVRGDDGYRVFLDDKEIISDWTDHGEIQKDFQIKLKASRNYSIRVEYYENGGSSSIKFGYQQLASSPAIPLAKEADAAIICVGFNQYSEGEGYDRPFELSPESVDFIKKVALINPNTIVVLFGGGNMRLTPFIDQVPSILHAWYPGQEGGQAIAEIILGMVNPSGRLPASFETEWADNPVFNSYYDHDGDKRVAYTEGIFLGYRGYDRSGIQPRFPFGFGLSYTTFEFSDLTVSKWDQGTETIIVSVNVMNTGKMAGAEVVQCYVKDNQASVERPEKELKGFEKVTLQPGESQKVNITLDKAAFSFYDVKTHEWIMEPGLFTILIGHSSADIRLTSEVEIN